MSEKNSRQEQLKQLKEQLADLRGRIPAHSVSAAMVAEEEDLEDQIARLEKELEEKTNN